MDKRLYEMALNMHKAGFSWPFACGFVQGAFRVNRDYLRASKAADDEIMERENAWKKK